MQIFTYVSDQIYSWWKSTYTPCKIQVVVIWKCLITEDLNIRKLSYIRNKITYWLDYIRNNHDYVDRLLK